MRKSRLSQRKQYKLIDLFVAGSIARTVTEFVNVNCPAFYFHRLHLLIDQNNTQWEIFKGKIETDESNSMSGEQKSPTELFT